MDEQERQIQYRNEQHQRNAAAVKTMEEERRLHDNLGKQRNHLTEYLEFNNTEAALTDIQRKKNGRELLKTRGVSLLSMKSATERIYHKDRQNYTERRAAKRQALKNEYRTETGNTLSDSKATLAHEYQELLENCRVFDNEVRETVEETLTRHPNLLAGYENGNLASRSELLSRLLTAFLPEREFHFNPPSGNQKSKVKDYLSAFRKNPEEAIRKMQRSLSGERMHKDLMNAAAGTENLRMLYCDMKKREMLAKVFPYVEAPAAEKFEAQKAGETVEDRKTMIKDLFLMHGMAFDFGKDLEFNPNWVNTKTLQGRTSAEKKALRAQQTVSGFTLSMNELNLEAGMKEEALAEYLRAADAVRTKEREINRYYKDQINAGITQAGTMYDAETIHKNYRAAQAFATAEARADQFVEAEEDTEVPFTIKDMGKEKVKTHSENFYAHRYLLDALKKTIKDANYTRYRRERLKKVKASPSLPAAFLERNRKKEEGRLRLLENRIEDFQALLRLMEGGDFRGDRIEDERLRKIYEWEVKKNADESRQREALQIYERQCDQQIAEKEEEFQRLRSQHYQADVQLERTDDLSISTDTYDAFRDKEERIRPLRLWKENKARYLAELAGRKEAWKQEDRLEYVKKLGKEFLNIREGFQNPALMDQSTREEKLQLEVVNLSSGHIPARGEEPSPLMKVQETERDSFKKLFASQRDIWNRMSEEEKKNYYFKLQGRDRAKEKPDESGYSKEDLWELTKEEEELLVRYFSGDTYWEYRENFDEKGNLILPENAPKFSEEQKVLPDQAVVRLLIERMNQKINYRKNRTYLPELEEYFREFHYEREGTLTEDMRPTGRVKFNVEHYVKRYAQILENRKEEIKKEKERLLRMKEKQDEQQKEIGEFSDRIFRIKEEYKVGQVITADFLRRVEELKAEQTSYFEKNGEEMLQVLQARISENLNSISSFGNTLWSNYNKQNAGIVKECGAELKDLDALMKKKEIKDAQQAAGKLLEKIEPLILDEKYSEFGKPADQKSFRELKRKAEENRRLIEEELSDRRREDMKEIDTMYGELLSKPDEEIQEVEKVFEITEEDRTLRRVSLLAVKLAAYLEADQKRDSKNYNRKLFGRDQDLKAAQDLMKNLQKNYMKLLDKKVTGKEWDEIREKAKDLRYYQRLNLNYDPSHLDPKMRYQIKYARGYLALKSWKQKEKDKDVKKREDLLRDQLGWLQSDIFAGTYTGLESEKEEEAYFALAKEEVRKLQEKKKALELELAYKKGDETAESYLKTSEAVKAFQALEKVDKEEALERVNYEKLGKTLEECLAKGKEEFADFEKRLKEAKDAETVSKIKSQREAAWDSARNLMWRRDRARNNIKYTRMDEGEALKRIANGNPPLFSNDPKNQVKTRHQKVVEIRNRCLVMQDDPAQKELQEERKKERITFVNYLYDTNEPYLMKQADEALFKANSGDLYAMQEIMDRVQIKLEEFNEYKDVWEETGMEAKLSELRQKLTDKEAEAENQVLFLRKEASDTLTEKRINEIPDDLTIDMISLSKIWAIYETRQKDIEEMRKILDVTRRSKDEALQPYQEFCKANKDSPMMQRLKKKILKPLAVFAENTANKADQVLDGIDKLKKDEKLQRIQKVRILTSDVEGYFKTMTSMTGWIGWNDDVTGVMDQTYHKLEDALYTYTNEVKEERYQKKGITQEKSEKLNKTINKMRENYEVLSNDIAVSASQSDPLDKKDISKLQNLLKDLDAYDKNENLKLLLELEHEGAQSLKKAVARDRRRINDRLALHDIELKLKKELSEMEKGTERKEPDRTDLSAVMSSFQAIQLEIMNYEAFEKSSDYRKLEAEGVDEVPSQVYWKLKELYQERREHNEWILDIRFEEMKKNLDVIAAKEGRLGKEDMVSLMDSVDQLESMKGDYVNLFELWQTPEPEEREFYLKVERYRMEIINRIVSENPKKEQ